MGLDCGGCHAGLNSDSGRGVDDTSWAAQIIKRPAEILYSDRYCLVFSRAPTDIK
jgi:hypothetical protein